MRPSRVSADGSDRPPIDELPTEFRVEVEPDREAVRVCPIGDVDLSTVDEVRAQVEDLTAAGFKRVVLDLRQTTFLDSTGLRLVLDTHTASANDGTEFAVIAGPPEVQRAFEVAGLDSRLPFVEPGGVHSVE
jgi:anti-anti-sigma factor